MLLLVGYDGGGGGGGDGAVWRMGVRCGGCQIRGGVRLGRRGQGWRGRLAAERDERCGGALSLK